MFGRARRVRRRRVMVAGAAIGAGAYAAGKHAGGGDQEEYGDEEDYKATGQGGQGRRPPNGSAGQSTQPAVGL